MDEEQNGIAAGDANGVDPYALDELLPAVYDDLRRLAGAVMRGEREGHTLQPTALVHEAYLRLAAQQGFRWQSRSQVLAVAGRVMRRVLVDHARARVAAKRGGHAIRVTMVGFEPENDQAIDVDRVKGLFAEALEMPEAQRRELVEQTASVDPTVAAELESLLAVHERAEGNRLALEHSTTGPVAGVVAGRSMVGRMVGAYRLLKQIGGGGMGVVYLAERADGQFDKKVAVKLIRPGMDTGEIMQRFELERHTLASLEHANIARLLDSGTTDDDQPFLVMEFVEGDPIDVFCDRNRLDTSARLRLLLTVCDAVQHAQRNLLVHRDLKPENILVTTSGAVKLLDFGIVKLLSPERIVPLTAASERIMTPGYASPEQLLGQPVSTASDVYSLGVVAYVLLTGHHPYVFTGPDPVNMARVVCEEPPRRPSTVVLTTQTEESGQAEDRPAPSPDVVAAAREGSVERLRRRLAGDVDLILLTALRKAPERRYASVGHLADDIRRHLDGLPIAARQDSILYRCGKFVRRHTLGTGAAATIALLLVGGVAAISWQAQVAARERDRARAEADKATAINEFLQGMLSSVDPQVMGRDVTVAEVLDRASSTAGGDLVGQPEIEATVRTTLGRTYQSLGRYQPADEQLSAALGLLQDLYGEDRAEVAAALTHLGSVRPDQGLLGEADTLYRRAMVIHTLAVLHHGRGELGEAETLYREALEITRRSQSDDSPATASCLHNLASVLHSRRQWAEAEPLYRQALALRLSLLGPDHPQVALTLADLADVLTKQGKLAEAEKLAREGLELDRRILPEDHPLLARTLIVLAEVLLARGDAVAAEAAAREALSLRQTILPPRHWLTANAEVLLGRCLAAQGRFVEAEELLVVGFRTLNEDRGSEHELTVAARQALAELQGKAY